MKSWYFTINALISEHVRLLFSNTFFHPARALFGCVRLLFRQNNLEIKIDFQLKKKRDTNFLTST